MVLHLELPGMTEGTESRGLREQPPRVLLSSRSRSAMIALAVTILAAALNILTFGFAYGSANHAFELPLVNWLQQPSLYPHDLLRTMFATFPTAFWPVVAELGRWIGTFGALWALFVVTKLLFFAGIVGLLQKTVRSRLLAGTIAVGIAVSPFLNGYTPFGASDILNETQTQTSLAVALLVCALWFLLEKRWIETAIAVGAAIFINCAFAGFFIVPLIAFAVLDWRSSKSKIITAGTILAAASSSYLFIYARRLPVSFPSGYIRTVLWRYPLHWRLFSHPDAELFRGACILMAAAAAFLVARKYKVSRDLRLELLTAVFALYVAFGALAGRFFLNHTIILLQPLRSDSFLFLLAFLLIAAYSANALVEALACGGLVIWAFAVVGLLLPLVEDSAPLILFLVCAGLALFPRLLPHHFSFKHSLAGSKWTVIALIVLAPGTMWVLERGHLTPLRISLIIALVAAAGLPRMRWDCRADAFAAGIVGLAFVLTALHAAPNARHLWDPENGLTPADKAWRQVQFWAKANTSPDSEFLTPPYEQGFRSFSERSSWVEWKDGAAIAFDPAMLAEWLRRVKTIGSGPEPGRDCRDSMLQYDRQPWEKLRRVALANGVRYIVQARSVFCPERPLFANAYFAVYPADP